MAGSLASAEARCETPTEVKGCKLRYSNNCQLQQLFHPEEKSYIDRTSTTESSRSMSTLSRPSKQQSILANSDSCGTSQEALANLYTFWVQPPQPHCMSRLRLTSREAFSASKSAEKGSRSSPPRALAPSMLLRARSRCTTSPSSDYTSGTGNHPRHFHSGCKLASRRRDFEAHAYPGV